MNAKLSLSLSLSLSALFQHCRDLALDRSFLLCPSAPLGLFLGPLGALGPSWGPLGALWGLLGGLLGALGGVPGGSRRGSWGPSGGF